LQQQQQQQRPHLVVGVVMMLALLATTARAFRGVATTATSGSSGGRLVVQRRKGGPHAVAAAAVAPAAFSSPSRALLRRAAAAAEGSSSSSDSDSDNNAEEPLLGWLPDERLSLAPMMEYTDRHLRFLLRLLSTRMVLYTEMITAMALVHCSDDARDRFLRFNDPGEHPVVLQLGGSDAAMLREAARMALPYGYDAINLNCGCPSERVSGSGCFGAALMREPQLVAELCRAMGEGAEGKVPITVKCRIGVDDDDSYEQLARFVKVVSEGSPVRHFVVHARKAILGGLSPEQNRKVPPLKYPYVYRLVKVRACVHRGLDWIGFWLVGCVVWRRCVCVGH
jgi:hypothetical protein